jgi:hypothetical protein
VKALKVRLALLALRLRAPHLLQRWAVRWVLRTCSYTPEQAMREVTDRSDAA